MVAVLGVLRDKEWRGMMRKLCPLVDRVIITSPLSAPANRAWDPDEAITFANANGWRADKITSLDAALIAADAEAETILVTGSFHTVGDAMQSPVCRFARNP
jgi:dihydrofolate synthase/folylpolyglutamate synthase